MTTVTRPLPRLLRRQEVEARTGLSRNTIYRPMRAGAFPEPLRVGPRAVRWPETEIEAWLSARPGSHGDRGNRPSIPPIETRHPAKE